MIDAMKLLVIVSLIIAAVAAAPSRNVMPIREALGLSPRIISGENAILGQFPWQALNLYYLPEGEGRCGGALINRGWILTASQCVEGALYFHITLGSLYSDYRYECQAITIETYRGIIHPLYESSTLSNDIALIDLQMKVKLSEFIKLIPVSPLQLGPNFVLTAIGWGKTSNSSDFSPILNFVKVTTITNTKCEEYYRYVAAGIMCCVGTPMHSTCAGDSGGPLVRYDKQGKPSHVGVISFVHPTGCASGKPSRYTRTSYYRDWILDTMSKTKNF